jgi:hypothetical protein
MVKAFFGCQIELFRIRSYLEFAVEHELRLIKRYRHRYQLEIIEQMLRTGEYPRGHAIRQSS